MEQEIETLRWKTEAELDKEIKRLQALCYNIERRAEIKIEKSYKK